MSKVITVIFFKKQFKNVLKNENMYDGHHVNIFH